jgi:hypothetical protein
MKPKLMWILAVAIALGPLTLATDAGAHGGGGHGGGGHGGGGHGGGHAAGGHGGGHWGGGGHGGRHFGGVTSADVILPASTTVLLISGRATSVETTGLRAGTSWVEIISITTRSATDTDGIILPGSARLAGAAGVAAGVAGEAGSDRCSGRFF